MLQQLFEDLASLRIAERSEKLRGLTRHRLARIAREGEQSVVGATQAAERLQADRTRRFGGRRRELVDHRLGTVNAESVEHLLQSVGRHRIGGTGVAQHRDLSQQHRPRERPHGMVECLTSRVGAVALEEQVLERNERRQ